MSTIKSSAEHLTLNADGAGKAVKFQADGVEKASISSTGAFTATTIDATKLTGALPAIDGSALTNMPAGGKVVKVTQVENSTRYSLSDSSSHTLMSWSFTKEEAASSIYITGGNTIRGNYSDSYGPFCSVDGAGKGTDGTAFKGVSYSKPRTTTTCGVIQYCQKWDGISAGTHTVSLGWVVRNGQNSNRPGNIWNHNSSDDARAQQLSTTLTIMEVL